MALIKCTNCGHSISDRAVRCPKCGTPIQPKMEMEERSIYAPEGEKVEVSEIPSEAKSTKNVSSSTEELVSVTTENEFHENGRKVILFIIGIILVALSIGIIYLWKENLSMEQCKNEQELAQKAYMDSLKLVESQKQVAIKQARKDSLKRVEKFNHQKVKFNDVYVNISNRDMEHINKSLAKELKERGYSLLKKEDSSVYYEVYERSFDESHYYLGYNMEYSGYWKVTGTPCSGVELTVSDPESATFAIVYFENADELHAFIKDAEKAGFTKSDNKSWSNNCDYPYDCIKIIDATTLECTSSMPY